MNKKLFDKSLWKLFFHSKQQLKNYLKNSNTNDNNEPDDIDELDKVDDDCCDYDYAVNFNDHFNGLDIEAAITAHLSWKHKLETTIEQNLATNYDIKKMGEDCHCLLGKWIYHQALESYGDSEIYEILKKSHAKFHRIAAEILTDIENGNFNIAKVKVKRDLSRSSDAVQLDLLRLCITVI